MKLIMKIRRVDMDGLNGRDNHPEPWMNGRFVRITNVELIPDFYADEDDPQHEMYWFHGLVTNNHGEEIEVELAEYELEQDGDMPMLYTNPVVR